MLKKIRTLAIGVAAAAAALGLTLPAAGTAQAASCGTQRVMASVPTAVKSSLGQTLGSLYLGYAPSCRMMYAEVHWSDSAYAVAGSGSIWIQDGAGHQAGKVYFDSHPDLVGYWTSGFVPIDNFGYTYAMPHVYADWVLNSGPIQYFKCLTNHDWHGNWHDFATGYSDGSHLSESC